MEATETVRVEAGRCPWCGGRLAAEDHRPVHALEAGGAVMASHSYPGNEGCGKFIRAWVPPGHTVAGPWERDGFRR